MSFQPVQRASSAGWATQGTRMTRWWVLASVGAAVGCAPAAQEAIGSVQLGVLCARDPLPSASEGESWNWGGGADYPDTVYPNANDCREAIYQLPQAMEDPLAGEDGWPDTEAELRFALAALAKDAPVDPRRVIFLAGSVDIAIDPDPDPAGDDDDNPLVIPANTWLASIRGRSTEPYGAAEGVTVPNKGAVIASTRRNTSVPLIKVVGDNVRISGLRIWGPEPEQCPWEWYEEPKVCPFQQPCGLVCDSDDDGDPFESTRRCWDNEANEGMGGEVACIEDGTCFGEDGDVMYDCTSSAVLCAGYYDNACPDEAARDNCTYCTEPTAGIEIDLNIPDGELPETPDDSVNNAEIDNCDIGGFGKFGVAVERALGAFVHHNYIHHVQRPGLGYPVVVGIRDGDDTTFDGYPAASGFISHNRFQNYRHAVASVGGAAHDYTAEDNLALAKTIGRVFDVHGVRGPGGSEDTDNPAGGTTIVRFNKILQEDYFSMDVKATPAEGAYFYGNCTVRSAQPINPFTLEEEPVDCGGNPYPVGDQPPADEAVCQRSDSGGDEPNVWVGTTETGQSEPNAYDQGPNDCAPLRWCVSSRGIRPYEYMNVSTHGIDVLRYGDFDGDGRADVFRVDAGVWRVSYGGVGVWHIVHYDAVDMTSPADLMLGDFDGDGRIDVFRRKLVQLTPVKFRWEYFPGESEPATEQETWTGAWVLLEQDAGSMTVAQMAVGRFDTQDAKDDIFNANGTVWQYRKNGKGPWILLRAASTTMEDLAVGNFNGDAVSDVFWASGLAWRYFPGGAGSSVLLDPSNDIRVVKLKFGNLGGNSRTDIFYANGLRWRYKVSGTGDWVEMGLAAEGYEDLALGQFDDETGFDDLVFPGCH